MTLIVKISEHQFSDAVITQEFIDSEVVIEEDMTTFGVASFSMPIVNGLIEDARIEIFEVQNGNDIRVFSGFIYEIRPVRKQRGIINIVCRSEKALFQKRKVLANLDYTTTDIGTILSGILAQYTALSEPWILHCDFSQSISIDIKIGESVADILDELAAQCEAVRDIVDGKLRFLRNFGTNYVTGNSSYKEVFFDGTNPASVNISKVQLVGTATRSNIVIAKDYSGTVTVDSSAVATDGRIYGVVSEDFRDGNLSEKKAVLLERSNRQQRIYQIEIENNTLDVNIGDTIKAKIENTNIYYDIDADVVVTKKKITYRNASKICEYTIGEISVSPFSIYDRFRSIEKTIRQMKNK